MVITDGYLAGGGRVDQLITALIEAGLDAVYFDGTVPDPTTASLDAGLRAVRDRRRPPRRIRWGQSDGHRESPGSARRRRRLDARLQGAPPQRQLRPPGGCRTDHGRQWFGGHPVPRSSTDSESDEKMLCIGRAFLPVAAIVDFELTMTMPPRLTADTGIDALTHAVEAYVSRKNNPFSDGFGLSAITTIGRNLRRASHRRLRPRGPGSDDAGLHAGGDRILELERGPGPRDEPADQAHFHLAHGLSNAMLFPAVTRFSLSAATSPVRRLRAFGCADSDTSDEMAAERLVDAIVDLCRDLAVPTPGECGIDRDRWFGLSRIDGRAGTGVGVARQQPASSECGRDRSRSTPRSTADRHRVGTTADRQCGVGLLIAAGNQMGLAARRERRAAGSRSAGELVMAGKSEVVRWHARQRRSSTPPTGTTRLDNV